nr:HNH endonuclease [uncultured Draconibacterium sp.]
MIKIEKDLTAIPNSIQLPFASNFVGNIPSPPTTTHLRRMEHINAAKYISDDIHNSRYKQADLKRALQSIYKCKCAYCEFHVEQFHVEHYRPKDTYYWLAYSWDNLILACSTCNTYKDKKFHLLGNFSAFVNTSENIENIHISSSAMDSIERPKMVNPEVSDPLGKIEFEPNGIIKSNDVCFKYTIEELHLDRKWLNDARRKLINDFREDIRDILHEESSIEDQATGIRICIRKFKRDSENVKNIFLAFRRFAISQDWLNYIIKELN